MGLETTSKVKHGCCYPEKKGKPTTLSRALEIVNLDASTSSIPHIPAVPLSNEERKAINAYRLQVEKRRSIAIEYARRSTFR